MAVLESGYHRLLNPGMNISREFHVCTAQSVMRSSICINLTQVCYSGLAKYTLILSNRSIRKRSFPLLKLISSTQRYKMYCVTPILVLFTVFSSVRSAPLEIIEDEDNAEIAVPRSPKIQGSQIEYLVFPVGYEVKNLTCEVEGIPMPKVIWLKGGIEVEHQTPPLQEDFDAEKGLSTLTFPEKTLLNQDNNTTLAGNYTCVAANFIGRAKKTYILSFSDIQETEMDNTSTITMTTSFTTETTLLP